MTALLRYQTALLIGSHRGLPPVLLYAAWLVIGVQGGSPILGTFGYAAGVLVPVAAWLTRICVTNEPPAARSCVAAAAGPGRAHLAAVLTAAGAALLLALPGVLVVTLLSDPRANDHRAVPVLPAVVAGLLTALTCLLMGIAIGALSNWPVLRSAARGVPVSLTAALLVLVLGASPVNAALSGMIAGSAHGTVHTPWLPLAATLALAAAATAAACGLTSRRS
ncbi:ABC transporter [Streptomyces kronopolitis]|uniref:ABC transporter n=1 Tax=Streptomyces kronopolitis TaxID=1612435 RepID=UPI003435DC37